MLGTRGQSFRPTGDPATASRAEQVIEEREPAPRVEAPAPPTSAVAKTVTTARRARKQLPKSAPAPDPEEPSARTCSSPTRTSRIRLCELASAGVD
jgi:hypothetical protein